MEPILVLLSDGKGGMEWQVKPGVEIGYADLVLMLEKLKLDLLLDMKQQVGESRQNGVEVAEEDLLARLRKRRGGMTAEGENL